MLEKKEANASEKTINRFLLSSSKLKQLDLKYLKHYRLDIVLLVSREDIGYSGLQNGSNNCITLIPNFLRSQDIDANKILK